MVMGFITVIMSGMAIIVMATAGFSMLMFVLIMIMFGLNAVLVFQRYMLMARMVICMFMV